MAAVNLPDNPANGTTQTVGGITYTYNSSKGYWTAASSGGGGGGASVSTSDAAPGSPSDGDLWYDTDDGGMFVYYQDTDSSQWVEVIGSQGAAGPAGAAGATTAGVASVYATVDALPTSGNTQGNMAHVTANNTLYFWNGSGWYKIALINTNPSISGVASAYALAIDGTATTVTMTATDPEGLPITYSIASDTSGNIATVTQGTGASTNVFTITPSTNTAYAGSFTLTFRASDGVNIATAPATFTLQFQVQNQNYTTALITSVGANNATNASFDDKSTSNHTITANGNAHQTTFSPYRHGGYSHYYTASLNEYHTATISAIGTSWTIEGWFYRTGGVSSGLQVAGHIGAINAANGCSWGIEDTQIVFRANGTTDSSFSVSSTTNRWIHLAFDYDGTTLTCYVNGVSIGTASRTLNITETLLNIGYFNTSYTYEGYIKDMRISTSRRYTSAFTALTEAYGTDSDTDILVRNQPFIRDISSNSRTITASGSNGTHSQKPFVPFDAEEYSAASHLGSVRFDGTGDKLTIPGTYANFGTNPFTIEAWVYPTICRGPIFTTHRVGTASGFYFSMDATNTNLVHGRFFGNNADTFSSNNSVNLNQWNHFVLCREGTGSNQTRMFVNGKIVATYTDNSDYSSAPYGPFIGGYDAGGAQYDVNGNIADLRVVSGTAVYTAEFTPPTAPLTAITNTALLVQSTDAGIIDKAQGVIEVELAGDTKSSTAENKYLTSSMYFDGTGDYIRLAYGSTEIYSGDFTVELWAKFNTYQSGSSVANSRIFASRSGGNSADNLQIIIDYTGTLGSIDIWSNTYHISNATTNIADNNWHHIAVSRQGTSLKLFIDGTQDGSTATTSQGFRFSGTLLGTRDTSTDAVSKYTGYMSDVRITRGLARYTANFTPPAAALKG